MVLVYFTDSLRIQVSKVQVTLYYYKYRHFYYTEPLL